MKIERINENQIRCTLTSFDLSARNINLVELAYGTEKARKLFREMIQKASNDVGFEAEDIPLMVEAIPLPGESIMLVITKVEDPEELDTRFSKFAPGGESAGDEAGDLNGLLPEGADNVLDMFRRLIDRHLKESGREEQAEKAVELASELDLTRMYFFPNLDTVISAAHVLQGYYKGYNSLYRLAKDGSYCLVIRKSGHSPEEFNKVANILSEYGSSGKYSSASEAYLDEHEEAMVREQALQKLALL